MKPLLPPSCPVPSCMPHSASCGLAPWALMQMAFPASQQALSEVLKPAGRLQCCASLKWERKVGAQMTGLLGTSSHVDHWFSPKPTSVVARGGAVGLCGLKSSEGALQNSVTVLRRDTEKGFYYPSGAQEKLYITNECVTLSWYMGCIRRLFIHLREWSTVCLLCGRSWGFCTKHLIHNVLIIQNVMVASGKVINHTFTKPEIPLVWITLSYLNHL